MNKGIPIGIGTIVAIIIGLVIVSLGEMNSPEIVEEEPWRNSGPFSINKEEYKLGEKIFISIKGLLMNDAGIMVWKSPEGHVANIQPFDGMRKSGFNTYYEPDTSRFTGLYDVEQLVGTWTIEFNGTNYESLQFNVTNEFIEGAEAEIYDIKRPEEKPVGPPTNTTE